MELTAAHKTILKVAVKKDFFSPVGSMVEPFEFLLEQGLIEIDMPAKNGGLGGMISMTPVAVEELAAECSRGQAGSQFVGKDARQERAEIEAANLRNDRYRDHALF